MCVTLIMVDNYFRLTSAPDSPLVVRQCVAYVYSICRVLRGGNVPTHPCLQHKCLNVFVFHLHTYQLKRTHLQTEIFQIVCSSAHKLCMWEWNLIHFSSTLCKQCVQQMNVCGMHVCLRTAYEDGLIVLNSLPQLRCMPALLYFMLTPILFIIVH